MDPLEIVNRDSIEILRIATECLKTLPGDDEKEGYRSTLHLEFQLEDNVWALEEAVKSNSLSNLREVRVCTYNIGIILDDLSKEITDFQFKLPLKLKDSISKGLFRLVGVGIND